MDRRRFLRLATNTPLALAVPMLAVAAGDPQPIVLRAHRFEFTPGEIAVPAGRRVTFAVSSVDFVHGFSMPDFGVRQDLIPGRVHEVSITPATAGRFHFLCDNFCGDGHDRMMGILVVTAA
jgi:cytochrome c oxidase subunit 2